MKRKCWNCDWEYDADEIQFICTCVMCGTENDWTPYTPIKEEEMPFEKTESQGDTKWLKLPKEGEKYDFSPHGMIENIEKIDNADHKKGKFNFMKKVVETTASGKVVKVDEDCGYYYIITFSDGSKLSLSSWSPYFAMQSARIAEGVSMKVNHEAKGVWYIERVE